VIVVLVEFSDKKFAAAHNQAHFKKLFFSQGQMQNGSVREYFADVTGGRVHITGDVVGPFLMPKRITEYAHGASGTGNALPNARTLALDAAVAANPVVDFSPYDNDGNGFVDAFIVIHAGAGAEQTGEPDDIWSHKWVLSNGPFTADSTKIYAYLTVPEDSKIGVCCHELGHLLFGFPDLYDTDGTSSGVGNWCLMGGGSWGGGGDVPTHPSAWCKAQQEWVNVQNHTQNGPVTFEEVKTSRTVHRLWKDGSPSTEYFLVENRQKAGYDASLPSGGLLVWHIDEAVATNADEGHPKVLLIEADGADHLKSGANRGDPGDCFPGTSNNSAFADGTTPNSKSYNGQKTCVSVTGISASGPVMNAQVTVKCVPAKAKKSLTKEFKKELLKDLKDKKELAKEIKDKELKEKKELTKEITKELKEKDLKEKKELAKEIKEKDGKELKEFKEFKEKDFEKPEEAGPSGGGEHTLAERVAALEALVGRLQPFIDPSLVPDLGQGALTGEADVADLGKLAMDAARAKALLGER
jgi:immune inhibitor A